MAGKAGIKKLVSFTVDFGAGNKGIGVMKATVLERCPDATVITLCSHVVDFDVKDGSKNFEAVAWLPKGIHVCVVDPGVGTKRRAIVIETKRGDCLVGPDNGVMVSAAGFLGGVKNVYELSNEKYFRKPVSPIFHGRDVFGSVAGYLAAGVKPRALGKKVGEKSLVPAPYPEARCVNGKIEAEIIHVNSFGNVFFNVRAEEMHKLAKLGDTIQLQADRKTFLLPYRRTFGDVRTGKAVILDDDFGRVEAAENRGNFAKANQLSVGQKVVLVKDGKEAARKGASSKAAPRKSRRAGRHEKRPRLHRARTSPLG